MKLSCHGEHWPVIEQVDLKPTDASVQNYPNITRQRVFYAFCCADKCKDRRIYEWAPVYEDWRQGPSEKIRQRTFDNDWLPRYATDKMEPPPTSRRENYVGLETRMMNTDPETYAAYKCRKARVQAFLKALPSGVDAVDIYDPVKAFYKQQEQRKRG